MDNQPISSLSDFEQPIEHSPERGVEQPFPETRPSSSADSHKTAVPESDHAPTEPQNVVDKTDEMETIEKVVPGDKNTNFADNEENEFITQITSDELPNAKP